MSTDTSTQGDARPARAALEHAPEPCGHFVGRAADIERALDLVRSYRLVSLTGIGGIGKTEVALATAKAAASDAGLALERLIWMRLDGMARGDALLVDLAYALQLDPRETASVQDVARRIGETRMLLVLDGPELLFTRDRAGLRGVLDQLAWECPRLRLLIASQAPLGSLMAVVEHGFELGPIAEEDARALFLATATELTDDERDGGDLDAMIAWLSGHPLSIVLVGRQAASAPVARLLERLEAEGEASAQAALFDDPRRTPWERRACERLTSCLSMVFRALADRDPEAAEVAIWLSRFPAGLPGPLLTHVFGARAEAHRALLVGRHLAEETGPTRRLGLPTSIRAYAALVIESIAPARRAELVSESWGSLGSWLGALALRVGSAEARHAAVRGAREEANLEELLRAMDDAPLPASETPEALALADRVAGALSHFAKLLFSASLARAAEELAGEALARVHKLTAGAALARVLSTLGDLHDRTDRLTEAEHAHEEALPIYRRGKDAAGEASTRRALGALYARTGRTRAAEEAYLEALPLFRAVHDLAGEASALRALGDLHASARGLQKAERAYRAALPIYRGILDATGEAAALKAIGDCHARAGQWKDAESALSEAIEVQRGMGQRTGEAHALAALGDVLVSAAQSSRAHAAFASALALYRSLDLPLGEANALASLGNLSLARGDAEGAFGRVLEALAIHRKISDSSGIAAAYAGLSRAALSSGLPMRAVVLGAQALRIQQALSDREGQISALQDIARALSALGREDAESAAMLVAWTSADAIDHPFALQMRIATGMNGPPPGLALEAQITLTAALSDCESELMGRGEDPCAPL